MTPRFESSILRARHIDRWCRRFEHCWRNGEKPQIESFLEEVDPGDRAFFLEELLGIELELRYEAGEIPTPEEYCSRFDSDQDLIQKAFADLGATREDLSQATTLIGQSLGDYRITREIGRGGMGIVYEAIQQSLDRRTAVKVLKPSLFRSERDILRFQRESRTISRLHHSNIVEVYGVGLQNDIHYFAMRYIPGIGLDRLIAILKRRRFDGSTRNSSSKVSPVCATTDSAVGEESLNEDAVCDVYSDLTHSHSFRRAAAVARIGEQIADALDYAHHCGVIHRDVKPSNLLLDLHGTVWLSDFGLARPLHDVELTQSYDLIGTLRYMAPEAFGSGADERSDVYSLGLTLYELLVLKPVHEESRGKNPLEPVVHSEPVPPRQIDPSIPRDIDTIIMKAISEDPQRRYQTAKEFADDLRRFQNRDPIRARRTSWLVHLGRWAQRNRILSAVTAIAVLSLLTGITTTTWMWQSAVDSAREFAEERDRAIKLQRLTEIHERESVRQELRALEQSVQICSDRGADFRDEQILVDAFAWTVEALRQNTEVTAKSRATTSADDRSESQASAERHARTSRLERDLRQRLGLLRQRLPFPVVRCWLPAFVSDWYSGSVPFARATDRWNAPRLRLNQEEAWIDTAHGRRLRISLKTGLHQLQEPCSRSGDGTVMVVDVDQRVRLTQSVDGTLTLQHLNANKPPLVLEKPKSVPSTPFRIWLCCDDQRLVVQFGDPVSPEKSFRSHNLIWDLADGRLLDVVIRGSQFMVSDDKNVVFFSTYLHESIDLMTGKPIRQIHRPPKWQQFQVSHSADGRTTAIANSNLSGVVIHGTSTSPEALWHEPVNNGNSVTELQFFNKDSELWAGTNQGTIHCRHLHDPSQSISSINAGKAAITSICPDPSGRWVACGNALGEVRVLERTSGHAFAVLPHNDSVQSINWSSAGDLIGVLTRQGLLTVWDLKRRQDGIVTVGDSDAALLTVAFHPDGNSLLTGTADGRIDLRDAVTGGMQCEVESGEPVYRVVWNRSGSHFAAVQRTVSDETPLKTKVVKTWLTTKPETPLATGTPFAADTNAMAMPQFHPLDNRVFVHSYFTAFLLCCDDLKFTRGTPALKVDSTGWVRCAAISSDGRHVAIVGFCLHGAPHQIYVYSTNTKPEPQLLQLPKFDDCWQLAFAPDGKTLIAVGDFGTRAWIVETGQEIHQATVGWQTAAKGVYFSSSGRKMAITDFHNSTRLFSTEEPGGLEVVRKISNEPVRLPTTGQPTAAAFVSDESIVMIATAAGLHLFSTEKGDALMPMLHHAGGTTDVAFDAKRGRVAIGGQSSSLRIWKADSPAVDSLEELSRMSRRYALATVDTSRGTLVPLPANEMKSMNDDLTRIVADANPLDAHDQRVWHASQAAECRLMKLPHAERFHRDRAASKRPDGFIE